MKIHIPRRSNKRLILREWPVSSPGGRPGAVGLAPVPDVGAEGALAQHQGRAWQELAGGAGGGGVESSSSSELTSDSRLELESTFSDFGASCVSEI